MFVLREHLFCIGLVGKQALQFGGKVRDGEVIGEQFADDLFAGDDVDEREMAKGEDEGLCPADECDERR